MLLLEPGEGPLTVLATHRVVLGLDDAGVAAFLDRASELFEVRTGVSRDQLVGAFAADGDVMPQKSTYIYPKALTGLVINPLE